MTDRYLEFMQSPAGRRLGALLGLPVPPRLRRSREPYGEQPLSGRRVLLAGGAEAGLSAALLTALQALGAQVFVAPSQSGFAPIKRAAREQAVTLLMESEGEEPALDAIVFDGSGLADAAALVALHELFAPRLARLRAHGRVVLIGLDPGTAGAVAQRAALGALRGFVKALGKELGRKGSTVNLIELAGPTAAGGLGGALCYLLGEHSAFVSGQVLRLDPGAAPSQNWAASLANRRALVTGAARGIGASIVRTLAREGARIVGVDRPEEEAALAATLAPVSGEMLMLDVTAADAAERIRGACGSVDIVVHNAGITRDRLLRRMSAEQWRQVLDVNLGALLGITAGLLREGLGEAPRVVCLSSIGGIGGNPGQTNYAASKAGIIGLVDAWAPEFARRGGAINAVAPGFIETRMTAQMPAIPRAFGRRLSALLQSGQPEDVAEAVTFLASPLASGLNGRTLRVCGQHLMGA